MRADSDTKAYLLQRIDPLSKLALLLCMAVLSMHWEKPAEQASLLVAALLSARFAGGMPWRQIYKGMAYIIIFALPLFIVTLIAAPAEGRNLLEAGPLSLSSGGIDAAGGAALRLLVLFLSSLIYIRTTEPRDFVYMLTVRLKVPYRLAFGVSIALTFVPLLEAEARNASAARRIRRGYPVTGISGRMAHLLGLAAAVFTAAIRRVQQTAGAMDAKGFGAFAERTFLRVPKYPVHGRIFVICGLGVTVGLWLLG
ncbi:energy-coupling factor transporter transmembrane protein EcfT [Paenibacillus sp. CAA11]|uniref:energy-coupling factor transporter transmembrane component T family protein n=1 Tax=Paenibacillus sp. CAA11 TaxID=1532905 RepID=UPI000D3A9BB4|nr:energy-coupling factor transporter transmembrane component T [Paenibacillus sp. CAA11]AWB43326.1 energy-coupling factor transporter transmembrane protein EcfT [Paenibacillus sp. CAA11]